MITITLLSIDASSICLSHSWSLEVCISEIARWGLSYFFNQWSIVRFQWGNTNKIYEADWTSSLRIIIHYNICPWTARSSVLCFLCWFQQWFGSIGCVFCRKLVCLSIPYWIVVRMQSWYLIWEHLEQCAFFSLLNWNCYVQWSLIHANLDRIELNLLFYMIQCWSCDDYVHYIWFDFEFNDEISRDTEIDRLESTSVVSSDLSHILIYTELNLLLW
jgi:hypothetical protein